MLYAVDLALVKVTLPGFAVDEAACAVVEAAGISSTASKKHRNSLERKCFFFIVSVLLKTNIVDPIVLRRRTEWKISDQKSQTRI